MRPIIRSVLTFLSVLLLPVAAHASICHAFVEGVPGVRYAQLGPVSVSDPGKVTIEYVTHSAYRITTPENVVIVTDYFGAHGQGKLPDIVTMNHAHETHYTDFPNPDIRHVLRGWNPLGDGPAKHMLEHRDVVVRNVTTDIRGWGEAEVDGNSIFVFEVADICIGHLGHLHHTLTDAHYAMLGKLDIVMVPVDGTYTLDLPSMIAIVERLKSRIVLPMHAFGPGSMKIFVDGLAEEFAIRQHDDTKIEVSLLSLPSEPTVMLLSNHYITGWD